MSELLREKKQKARNMGDLSSYPNRGQQSATAMASGDQGCARNNGRNTALSALAVLPRDREAVLAKHIAELSSCGYRYYIIQILQMATQMLEYYGLKSKDGALINESWYSAFLDRWPIARTVNKKNKLVPPEALKCINWDLVDLAATQDALALAGERDSQSKGKVRSASAVMTNMIVSYCSNTEGVS